MKHPVVTSGAAGGIISLSTGSIAFFFVGVILGVLLALLLKK